MSRQIVCFTTSRITTLSGQFYQCCGHGMNMLSLPYANRQGGQMKGTQRERQRKREMGDLQLINTEPNPRTPPTQTKNNSKATPHVPTKE